MLGFITSKMLEIFIARSGPDLMLHILNVLFTVVWVAIAFGIYADMLQESSTKSAALRMKAIARITISTWFQGQAYALFQIPVFYVLRVMCYGSFGRLLQSEAWISKRNPKRVEELSCSHTKLKYLRSQLKSLRIRLTCLHLLIMTTTLSSQFI